MTIAPVIGRRKARRKGQPKFCRPLSIRPGVRHPRGRHPRGSGRDGRKRGCVQETLAGGSGDAALLLSILDLTSFCLSRHDAAAVVATVGTAP